MSKEVYWLLNELSGQLKTACEQITGSSIIRSDGEGAESLEKVLKKICHLRDFIERERNGLAEKIIQKLQ